jgi:predicted component of type VI protein secretion system
VENRRESTPTLVAFEISGDMCPLPMPEALFLRTELDLDTGQCELKERG